MAIEFCPENTIGGSSSSGSNSRGMSPRISFSHEFGSIIPIEPHIPFHPSLLDSAAAAADFDFCVRENTWNDQQPTSADELFSNGVIVPSVQIKKQNTLLLRTAADREAYDDTNKSKPSPSVPPPALAAAEEDGLKEGVKGAREEEEEEQLQHSSSSNSNAKSFWGFKRSRSLNCGSLYKRGLCPLPLLSRSKSTGSTSSSKKSLISSNKEDHYHPQRRHHHHPQQQQQRKESHSKKDQPNPPSVSGFRFSEPFSSSRMAMHNNSQSQHQKPPLLKRTGHHHQESVTNGGNNGTLPVNPILNVPSATVFGFGSIFSIGGKQKNGNKK